MLLLSCLYSVLWYIATFALNDGTALYYLSMYEFFWIIKFQSCHTLALVKYGIHGSL